MNKGIVSLQIRNVIHPQNCITVIAIIILENFLKVVSNAFESITLINMRRRCFWVPQKIFLMKIFYYFQV